VSVKKGYVLINVMAVLIIITLISTFVFKIVIDNNSYKSLTKDYKYEDLYHLSYEEMLICKVNEYFKDKKELLMDKKSMEEYGLEFLDMSLMYDKDMDEFILGYMNKDLRYEDIYLRYKEINNRIILIPDKELYNIE